MDERDNDALPGILWLGLHIQKSQFSTEDDHIQYFGMFSEVVRSLMTVTVEDEFQCEGGERDTLNGIGPWAHDDSLEYFKY